MTRILNSHTNTVHKPHQGSRHRHTQCGALTSVSAEQIQNVQLDELQLAAEITTAAGVSMILAATECRALHDRSERRQHCLGGGCHYRLAQRAV